MAAPGDGTAGPIHAWAATFVGPREPFHRGYVTSSQGPAEGGRRGRLRLQEASGVRSGGGCSRHSGVLSLLLEASRVTTPLPVGPPRDHLEEGGSGCGSS